MSSFVEWIAAEAEGDEEESELNMGQRVRPPADEQTLGELLRGVRRGRRYPRTTFRRGCRMGWSKMIGLIAILICGFTGSVRSVCCGATCAFQ